ALNGVHDDLQAHPEYEPRYFSMLYLDDWSGKITRKCRPVVNWPDPSQKWVGDPVKYVSVQVGYPTVEGAIHWQAWDFTAPEAPQAFPEPDIAAVTAPAPAPAAAATTAPVDGATPQKPIGQDQLVYASGSSAELFIVRETMKRAEDVT